MTKKTLEDKVKDAHIAFGNEYSATIKMMGYNLSYGISTVGVRDSDAPKKDKSKPCLVAYITILEKNAIEPETLVNIARNIIPNEYKGFRVFLEYREALKPRDNVGSKPAYGVPFPPDDEPVM
ncbi:MAG: hypothetical protein WC852_03715 [Candidatus Nanoarchaeia archaeon]|jgi:hypothetical protein